jgi:hypothetical protein
VVQNITNNTIINNTNIKNVTNIRNVTMLTPLSRVDPAVTRLQPVSEQGQKAAFRSAQERLAFAGQRGNLESKLLSQGRADASGRPATVKTTTTPQVVKVNLPRTQDKAATASKAPAPLTTRAASTTPLPLAASGGKPLGTAVNPAAETRRHGPLPQAATTTPTVKTPAAAVKPVGQHPTIQSSATKPTGKPSG